MILLLKRAQLIIDFKKRKHFFFHVPFFVIFILRCLRTLRKTLKKLCLSINFAVYSREVYESFEKESVAKLAFNK